MDIRIEGDPTSWTLGTPIDPGQVTAASGPVVLEVAEPLGGRLLLSPRSVGSVVFFQPAASPRHGVVPNGVKLPGHCLYVASATGPDPHSNPPRYYLLPQPAGRPGRIGGPDHRRDERGHHCQGGLRRPSGPRRRRPQRRRGVLRGALPRLTQELSLSRRIHRSSVAAPGR